MEDTKNSNPAPDEVAAPVSENIEEKVNPETPATETPETVQVTAAPVTKEPPTLEKIESEVQTIVEKIVTNMGIKSIVRTRFTDDSYYTNIRSRNSDGLLIGKRGMTALSIQSVVNQIMRHRYPTVYIDVFVDVSGYRKRHENFLRKKALAVAKVVTETKLDMALDILTEREYRMVEKELAPLGTVRVHAIGSGFRKTVIVSLLQSS